MVSDELRLTINGSLLCLSSIESLGLSAIQNMHESRMLQLNAIDTVEDVFGGTGNDRQYCR